MGKVLGIDYGKARVGLAISDEMRILASAHSVLENKQQTRLLEMLCELIYKENIEEVVVGLPLNMNGSHGDAARDTMKFAESLEKKCGRKVHLLDERLSTVEAAKQIHASGKKTNRKNLDLVAATIILQAFIDRRKSENDTAGTEPGSK